MEIPMMSISVGVWVLKACGVHAANQASQAKIKKEHQATHAFFGGFRA